ncbi:MAG: type II secretion system protein GspD, partial [Planctomycetota bacterium]|jgi:type II secretory pathway component GspD/PulD (secretin)
LTETAEFGIEWSNIPGVELTNGGVDFQGGVLDIGISIDDITGLITASEEVDDTAILANPKILALNKQAGKLIIGDKEGYEDTTTQNQSGSTTQSIAFLESGTILEFRPFIGKDGLIRMELSPEQSSSFFTGPLLSIPNKTTTNIITNVLVKDGQTIVLGGLFQEETTLGFSQVPLLGDVPVVGELFKGETDTSQRTELIVLITPHIIVSPDQLDGENRMEDVLRMNQEMRQNLIWLSRAKLDEMRYADAVELYTNGQPEAALAKLNSQLS